LLAVAVDPDLGMALVTTRQGTLKHYSYPAFTLRATYRLERPAYHAVLDGAHGQLYAAVSDPAALHVGLFGDRVAGRGDLHVYDVRPLLQGKASTTEPLQPVRVLGLSGPLGSLLLSPDHEALYYLTALPAQILITRYSTTRRTIESERKVPNGMGGLCLTPDGQTLVVTTAGNILTLDPVSLEVRSSTPAGRVPFDVAATNEGVVFFSERGVGGGVAVLDLRRQPSQRGRWGTGLPGRTYLQLAPDQSRLYVGNASPLASRLYALLLTGDPAHPSPVVGEAGPDGNGWVRGEFFITPDSQFLVNRWGKVYRLAKEKG
jgi:DNA-binding beta-propeller fold protein YncE